MPYIITKQNVITNELDFISLHNKYELALNEIHTKLLNKYGDDHFIKFKNENWIVIHKRGTIYGSSREHIYRIKQVPNLTDENKIIHKKILQIKT